MKIQLICFSQNGAKLGACLKDKAKAAGYEAEAYVKGKFVQDSSLISVKEALGAWTKARFKEGTVLVFIGATGIAVRSIAPYIKSKDKDPAVVVIDEQGNYVISLLSGHIGSGNTWTRTFASWIGAVPVVTTATDINGKIAIDEWAMKQGLFLESLPMAKEISAGILAGEPVGFFSDFPVRGSLPPELSGGNEATLGVVISDKAQKEPRFSRQLNLVPKRYSLGIGCRRGTKKEKIEELVDGVCTAYNIAQEAIAQVATIDLKKDEEGLLAFCRERKLKLITYTGEALAKLEGEFTPSAFVQSVTGVDNVCERAAIMDGGTLWIKKTAKDGVTLAVAKKEYDSSF